MKICHTEVHSLFRQQKQLTEQHLGNTVKKNKNSSQLWPRGSLPAWLRPAWSLDGFSNCPLFWDCYKVTAAQVVVWNGWGARGKRRESACLSTLRPLLFLFEHRVAQGCCVLTDSIYVSVLRHSLKGAKPWEGIEKTCKMPTYMWQKLPILSSSQTIQLHWLPQCFSTDNSIHS